MLALVASAVAQFTAPAPLAWRWFQSTTVAPSGKPVVDGDTIYYAVGSRLNSINLTTGNTKWRFPADGIPGAFRSTPLLVNGLIVVVGDNGTVYAVEPGMGTLKWSYSLPGKAIGNPVMAGKYIVISQADNKLVAIDPANGQAAWSNPITIYDGIRGQIGTNGEDVLVFDQNNMLYSISTITQKTTWKLRFVQLESNVSSTTVGDTIYVNSGPDLIALNALTGRARWDRNTRQNNLIFAPAVSATTILVVTDDGKALAYDLSGKPIMNASQRPINLGSTPVVTPTAVADSMFVVPTANGSVNLVDPTYAAPVDANAPPKANPDDIVISLTKVDAPSPDLMWSFLIPPATTESAANSSGSNSGFPGMGPGAGPGAPGFGGSRPGTNQTTDQVISVRAASPAVLAGQTLLVSAKDGSLLAFDKSIGVDLTPPGVKLLWPSSGEQVSPEPPLQLIFKISDDATGVDVKTLSITIDGQPYTYGFSRDGFATVAFSKISGKNPILTNGRKSIVVSVADWMGNKIEKTFALFIDNTLRPIVPPWEKNNTPGTGFPGGPGKGGRGGGGPGGGLGGGA